MIWKRRGCTVLTQIVLKYFDMIGGQVIFCVFFLSTWQRSEFFDWSLGMKKQTPEPPASVFSMGLALMVQLLANKLGQDLLPLGAAQGLQHGT